MTVSSASKSAPSWKDYFLKTKQASYSNFLLAKIRESVNPSRPFLESILEISRNPGIALLSMDASEEKLQLFHSVSIIGGSWTDDKVRLVGALGSADKIVPIQIMTNSIKEIKGKSHSFNQLVTKIKLNESWEPDRTAKTDFHNFNMLPIPALLSQVFLSMENLDPLSVASAFFQAMYVFDNDDDDYFNNEYDHEETSAPDSKSVTSPKENTEDEEVVQDEDGYAKLINDEVGQRSMKNSFSEEFSHIIQFCQLCAWKKVPPVLYTLIEKKTVQPWLSSVHLTMGINRSKILKRCKSNESSPQEHDKCNKLSRKDEQMINTMIKLHECFDTSMTRSIKDKEEKEPGFNRLEAHKKQLILNASAVSPYDTKASEPSEFFKTFLQKKTQFKAKEFLVHRLHIDNIAFHPSSTFSSCLWNCDFLWLTPDLPSGISIFFCPELSSLNSHEIEKDRNLAAVEKIKTSDIDKVSKEKFAFPESIMDLVWMTQNYHAVIALCFGPKSHSAKFLQDWGNHMYNNRMMYKSLQARDNSFFTQVLFCIDRALQIHWCSCCNCEDRESVNDKVLFMSNKRDLIIEHNFTYTIPKLLQDKVLKPPQDVLDQDKSQKFLKGKNDKDVKDKDNKNGFKSLKDIIVDNDPNHTPWRLQDGENFSKLFYFNQKKCPKTADGKQICMKLFIRGICDKSCSRVHKLSKDDEKNFGHFVERCREGGFRKPDF